jgi:phosphoglycerate kinase
MRTVRDIPYFQNIPILVRAAMNVPLEGGRVANEYRLQRALPTIRFLSERGARVILISHIGEEGTETLAPVYDVLKRLLPRVSFFPETIGIGARDAVRALLPGNILVLENLRRHQGEKMNDPTFAKELAMLGDIFVEDSFDTCHRAHASIVSLPKLLPSYAGLTLEEEVLELRKALTPKNPSLAVIGGAKFSTKEAVLTKLLEKYDHVFVGGALANDFLKAAGHEVGKSLVSDLDRDSIQKILNNPKLVLPVDVLVIPAHAISKPNEPFYVHARDVRHVCPDEIILDQGSGTNALLVTLAEKAKSILWNGPLGKYEDGFITGTDSFARAVAASQAHSVVGGGDTVASIESLDLLSKFSFVSTGGGAMLEFLAKGTLPGIKALDAHLSD